MKINLIYKIFIAVSLFLFRKTRRTPLSFNEKIKFKAAFDRREILTKFTDKIAVREYVSNTIGDKYLAKVFFKTDAASNIDWDLIPNEFVMKANHCSGGTVIVWKGSDEISRLPKNKKDIYWNRYLVSPNNLIKEDLACLANSWLKKNYAYSFPSRRVPEWAYLNIYPQILFEELLLDNGNKLAKDYKFHIFNGKCEMINVIERNQFNSTKSKRNFSSVFDDNWRKMDVSLNGNFPPVHPPEKPDNLDEMLDIALRLANNLDFIRVDLYNVCGRIVFGELTSYPQSGHNTYHFEPYSVTNKAKSRKYDEYLGEKLVLDDYESSTEKGIPFI
jgi:hypothetical protein